MENQSDTELRRRNPGSKAVSVAAGESHIIALSGDGKVYSWGRGTFGRLGTGSDSDEYFPVSVNFDVNDVDKPRYVVGVAAGAYHSLALVDDGSVWCWGYNTYGQLGYDGDNVSVPRQMDQLVELDSPQSFGNDSDRNTKTPLKISSIKAGGMMSLAIDNFGGLWIWGNCPQPRFSSHDTFSLSSISTPVPVLNFHGHTVVKVACGNEHVVALVSAGETYRGDDLVCYTWGNNKHGQLGWGDTESRFEPQVVPIFSDGSSMWSPYEVACGAFHSVVLALKTGSTDTLESVCLTFGLGENGQLGHGTSQNALVPKPIEQLPRNTFLVSVDCGLFHTSVVSSAGEVWSWGMERGLGLCPDVSFSGADQGDALSPLLIPCSGPHPYGPKFPGPVQVVCGAAHTVILADDGYKLWSWGRGRSGVLGHGKAEDSYSPILVSWPPLSEDFQEELQPDPETRDSGGEMEKRLSLAIEEIKVLQSKLSATQRYASIVHGAIFGRPFEEGDIPSSLYGPGSFDIAKEWENMLDSSDRGKLTRLEMFFKSMVAGVKDRLLKNRVQEFVQECLQSSSAVRREH